MNASRRLLSVILVGSLIFSAAGCRSSSTTVLAPTTVRCAVTLQNSGSAIEAAGGTASVSVGIDRECAWTAASEASWISLMSEPAGQGVATLRYRVAENTLVSTRRGSIVVNDSRVDVTQSAA